MNADARWNEDAELLAQLVAEGTGADDPRAGALLERRPEWRELLARAAEGAAADGTHELSPAQAEADRRLVAECLAAARSPAPSARGESATMDGARPALELRRVEAPAPPRARRWPRILLALAATLALAWLARLWWASEQRPQREPGTTLGGPLDSQLQGHAAPDLSSFAWEIKGDRSASESFCFSVWAETSAGARGERLFRKTLTETQIVLPESERAGWPRRVIWRVDRIDSSGTTALGAEWRAERAH